MKKNGSVFYKTQIRMSNTANAVFAWRLWKVQVYEESSKAQREQL